MSKAERDKYQRWKKSFGSFEQRKESKEKEQDDGKDHKDIRDFVNKALGENNKITSDVFAFLVDPERGAFDHLKDLLSVNSNDIDELCEEAGIKHGNKVKFRRAVNGQRGANE